MSFTRNLKNFLDTSPKLQDESSNNKSVVDGEEEEEDQEWSCKVEDYVLLEQIGSGSFGQVYRARASQKPQNKLCAIKSIAKRRSPHLGKILTEVSIHLRLRHENILRLWTVAEDVDHVYLVMELCHGSLGQLISRQTKVDPPVLPYETIGPIVRQLCDALQYLHRNSIIHRDLNTNNILLVNNRDDSDSEIRVKLADFGLALDLAQRGSNGTICGTPGYIPPEIWNANRVGSLVDFKCDLFSLGSVIYACVAGQTPKGDLDLSTYPTMVADLITRLLDHRPDWRPSLEEIQSHPFTCGRLNSTIRLNPLEKTIHKVTMSIREEDHHVSMSFPHGLTLQVTPDGSEVTVLHGANKATFYFYDLPRKYWNRFAYLRRFVNLVRSKTAKITVHCPPDWCPLTSTGYYVSRCTLMESGLLEVTQMDPKLGEEVKWIFDDNRPGLSKTIRTKLELLKSKMSQLARQLETASTELNLQLLPATFSLPLKKEGLNKRPKSLVLESSQILRSVPMSGIGLVTQFDNGSIQVAFEDGSDLAVDGESQIFYLEHGVLKRFHKNELLPSMVVDKLSRMPQVIEHLRTQINHHNTVL